MSSASSQQLIRYYEQFRETDVTFNSQVIAATGLDPHQTHLKIGGTQLPCVVYSVSMVGARIIANVTPRVSERIREAGGLVSLRFGFHPPEEQKPIFFFAAARVGAFSPYASRRNTVFVNLEFTGRPPDDLIEIVGQLVEVGIAAKRRREERIILTRENLQRLGMEDRGTALSVEGRRCRAIIRDVSFGGAKILLAGSASELLNRRAILTVQFKGLDEAVEISGEIIRVEDVQGRPDIVAVAVRYDKVPMPYSLRLNQFLQKAGPA